MCGIAGFMDSSGDATLVARMRVVLNALEHRGPDDSGMLTYPTDLESRQPRAGIGNRRLSIIDLTSLGHQPMTTADGRYSITYNGEIYNADSLRDELERLGHRFRSRTDTEVFLEAFAHWDTGAFARMEGMFAAAIIDRSAGHIVIVRDPFGIKPLFYHQHGTRIVFASEIGALREFGGIATRVNAERTRDFLGHIHTSHARETLYAEVQQLPAAHYATLPMTSTAAVYPVRYWSLATTPSTVSFAQAAEELRGLVSGSVTRHLRSDVPMGFSLSGGLDSSSVLSCARRALPDTELHAFGFATDDADLTEVAHQQTAASACAATLHAVRFDSAQLEREFDHLIDVQGEPFASPAICAQYAVFARAKEEGVKVILGGQGSDELFAGYSEYFPARVATLIRQGRLIEARHFIRAAGARWGISEGVLARRALRMAAPTAARAALGRVRGGPRMQPWLAATWFADRGVGPMPEWWPRGRELMKSHLAEVIEHVHLQPLMRYEDRSSMALSMESRVPFLTPVLAHFAFSLPESYLVSRDAEQKAVLRAAMRGLVPDAILNRRDKIGFGVPIVRWLIELSPWVEARRALVEKCPAIDASVFDRHWRAVRERGNVASAYLVWRCIVLAVWAERNGVEWE